MSSALAVRIARETVAQGVMLAPEHTAALLVLLDDLEARRATLDALDAFLAARSVMTAHPAHPLVTEGPAGSNGTATAGHG